jgi:Flavodoxin
MKFVVVYESMFGNTETTAQAIAAGLSEAGEVKLGTVDALSPKEVQDATLLVAGGPTHAHGMARRNAHEAIAGERSYRRYGPVQPGQESLRGWIERLTVAPARAAAFDTRFDKPMWITGSAAKKIAARLERKGYSVIEARSFFVEATGGPLAEGERDRAVEWGRELGVHAGSAVAA